jgi:hypothetical protein
MRPLTEGRLYHTARDLDKGHLERRWRSWYAGGSAKGRSMESKLLSVTLKTPARILDTLREEEKSGFQLDAVGTNFMFMYRESASASLYEHDMAAITFKTPSRIFDLIRQRARDGWELAALGASLAFFKRPRQAALRVASPSATEDAGFKMVYVLFKLVGGLRELLDQQGAEGWTLRAIRPTLAIFCRPEGGAAHPVEHRMISITLRGPGQIQELVNRVVPIGWRVAGVGRSFIFFSRPRLEASVG